MAEQPQRPVRVIENMSVMRQDYLRVHFSDFSWLVAFMLFRWGMDTFYKIFWVCFLLGGFWSMAGCSDELRLVRSMGSDLDHREIRAWETEGFSLAEAEAWSDGVVTSESGEKYEYGFSPKQADDWRSVGYGPDKAGLVTNKYNIGPKSFRRYQDEGFSLDRMAEWHEEGFEILHDPKHRHRKEWPDSAFAWFSTGASLEEALRWHKEGYTPAERKEWDDVGASLEKADRYRSKGFSPHDLDAIEGSDWDLEEALKWQKIVDEAEDISYSDAAKLEGNGVTPGEAKRLFELGLEVNEMLAFRSREVSVAELENFFDIEFETFEVVPTIKKFVDNNIRAEEAKKWNNWGFKYDEVDEITEWRDAGFSPKAAGIYANIKYLDIDSAKRIEGLCGGTPNRGSLWRQPPHDPEGGCFVIRGKVEQIIDSRRALVANNRGDYVLLRFSDAIPAEGTSVRAVVEPGEAFTYDSMTGTRTVPSGDVLSRLN